jgi:hypothetical protein
VVKEGEGEGAIWVVAKREQFGFAVSTEPVRWRIGKAAAIISCEANTIPLRASRNSRCRVTTRLDGHDCAMMRKLPPTNYRPIIVRCVMW